MRNRDDGEKKLLEKKKRKIITDIFMQFQQLKNGTKKLQGAIFWDFCSRPERNCKEP